VSRQVVFHSAALLGVGVYLLVMGAVGYYIRIFGGSWGGVLQTAFLFGAIALLLALLFSGVVRSRVRVLLNKHFFSYRFDYRQEWLRFTATLASGEPGVRLNERAISAIAQMVESPGGGLWLRDEHGDFERAGEVNLPRLAGSEPKDGPLARFLAERQWVISLDEYAESRDVYGELELPEWIASSKDAWVIVPLILHEDLLGFVVLTRPLAPQGLNWELTDLLKVAGRQAAGYLGHLRAAQQLLVARQFESFNKMSAFVIHDLKNIVAQLGLMLSNAEKHKHNPAFQEDMLKTVENAVDKMNRLLAHLRSGTTPIDKPVAVDLGELVARAVADKSQMRPRPEIDVRSTGLRALAHADRLQRVVGHLVQNAIEATPKDGGRVWVRVAQEGGSAVIEVGDTGSGMTAEFIRDRLFKPFESTKRNGMGIGTYESRQYVREIRGSLEVESQPGKGTRFRIVLPLPKPIPILVQNSA
jgi:putative PEP-CTERM system histidine kinase